MAKRDQRRRGGRQGDGSRSAGVAGRPIATIRVDIHSDGMGNVRVYVRGDVAEAERIQVAGHYAIVAGELARAHGREIMGQADQA